MNVQTHLPGQISGQMPNQASVQLSALPQQNGNILPPQIQNLSAPLPATFNMDPDLSRVRAFMQEKIFVILMQRHQRPIDETQRKKLNYNVKRLEEGLFKNALTKEEYMNIDTLESRLHNLLKRPQLNNQSQQYQPVVASTSLVGKMIPTPGISHSGNSNLVDASPVDNLKIAPTGGKNIASSTGGKGGLLPICGSFSNGYQLSSTSFSGGSGGDMTSVGGQKITSQMIPTPGFSNSSNSCSNNQSYMNMESSSTGGRFSAVESTMDLQQEHEKLHVGGQNSRTLHHPGSQIGSGIRSSLPQKSYGFTSVGSGLIGSNVQLPNKTSTTEGYAKHCGNSLKTMQPHFDHHQIPVMQGDGFGMNSSDTLSSGNLYGNATSGGTMMTTQNLNAMNLPAMPKTSSSLITSSQPNLHGVQQAAHRNLHTIDHSEKMNFHSPVHQQQQLHQQTSQFKQEQQFVQQQGLLRQQSQQQQHFLNNDCFGQNQLSSDIGNQIKHESILENNNGVVHSLINDQCQLPEIVHQFHQNSIEDHSRSDQCFSAQSVQHNLSSTFCQNSKQVQPIMDPCQSLADSQNDISNHLARAKSDGVQQNQEYPISQSMNQKLGSILPEHVQQDFTKRFSAHDEAQCNNVALEGCFTSQSAVTRSIPERQKSINAICQSGTLNSEHQYRNQQRWLLFLQHARRCRAPEGKCQELNCLTVQKLWQHLEKCNSARCLYPRCSSTRALLTHYRNCRDANCPICVPVRNFVQRQTKARNQAANTAVTSVLPKSNNALSKSFDTGANSIKTISKVVPTAKASEDPYPSLKRMKIEQASESLNPEIEISVVSASLVGEVHKFGDVRCLRNDNHEGIKPELSDMKMDVLLSSAGQENISYRKKENVKDSCNQRPHGEIFRHDESVSLIKHERVKVEKEMAPTEQEYIIPSSEPATGTKTEQEYIIPSFEPVTGTKSGKPKIKGVSLTELFTPEQVREHILGLRQWVGQSKAKAEKNQAMEHSMSANACQLCFVERLAFEPLPIYCSPCGARIKRNAMYYTVGAGDTRHYFCIPCYNESRGDAILVDGTPIPKARLEKKKNDDEAEEPWVQCDKCEAWQHQICALFNGRRNEGGQAEYTCPNCYIQEVKRGERKPLPQSAVLGAKDLPRTNLSDQIENRLFQRLKQERQDRARSQGKSYDEVPGAEALVIRVVSSVDKKLEVKQRFLEIFQEENYPSEFPYKSKVILLFQKIEGVEVCLFGMYVQEFGSECQFPNQRRVYLSYLDSVKYFRPEIKAVTGEALRTFVYHEILIGYLEYCKKRGFTSCYIWACPPLKGEDYILYCHPEIQKTPKSDKLREWYLSMLRKAAKENIVVDLTNLYDHFFVSSGECKAKVTAARLPYFDGDYWPGAAEDLIYQIRQEEDGRKQNKKGITKKTITKRALKASGHSDLFGNASKDLLLMDKLGETISPMKEDFIMVHLQHACSHCCILMVSGSHWVCNQCKNFHICGSCYEAEQKREERDRHPLHQREKHALYPIEITDVPTDTKDEDEILESEFFDTRQAFLSLCQGNHYQYDTLRRAKHSSMMVLYHLHNPTAPAFVTTCHSCHLDIETGQGWRCEVCPDYDVCNACYQKDKGGDHAHKLTNHPSMADQNAQNKEARQQRVLQLKKMLELLVHASQCCSTHCQYPNCRKVKGLFRHGMQCKTRASAGCVLCKKMWYVLRLHARACKVSGCHVPRCRDLKEHLRRQQQQSDSRRRAAVMEMMRQRAAELTCNV